MSSSAIFMVNRNSRKLPQASRGTQNAIRALDSKMQRLRETFIPAASSFSSMFKKRFPIASTISTFSNLPKLTRKDISRQEKVRIVASAAISTVALVLSLRTGISTRGLIFSTNTANLVMQTYEGYQKTQEKRYDL